MTELLNCNNDSDEITSNETTKAAEAQTQETNNGDDVKGSSKKRARPIPQLIPLNTSTPNQNKPSPYEPPQKKIKELSKTFETESNEDFDNIPSDVSLIRLNVATKNENPPKKKNESFFDKLKERLLTETGKEGSLTCKNCGFESKCLSEHSVHEKSCTSQSNRVSTHTTHAGLGSTRCQNCRHRCKSSADLYVHMQTCAMNNKTKCDKTTDVKNRNGKDVAITNSDSAIGPHPMENVVFVWNNIGRESNKYDNPLDININEDATLPPESQKGYDPNNVDALHDNEGLNLSPTQATGKKVYKCPHCPFWASTASRFHVHIVGHLNKKPFECSLCQYKSNWRWDITKHIKLKSARDPDHNDAKVLMTDETGRRNYSKYNKYIALLKLNENGQNEFQYIDEGSSTADASIELDETFSESGVYNDNINLQPLNLQTQQKDSIIMENDFEEGKKPKKTLWKCKKCNYK